jgi:Holliday junction resolvase
MPTPLRKMHVVAREFESDLADALNGRRVFLSGAGIEKADVRKRVGYTLEDGVAVRNNTIGYRVEAKTTRREYFTFKLVDWHDLTRAADMAGEVPIFGIRFLETNRLHHDVVVIRATLAKELQQHAEARGVHMTTGMVGLKSTRIRPKDRYYLELEWPSEEQFRRGLAHHVRLAVLPWEEFLEGMKANGNL